MRIYSLGEIENYDKMRLTIDFPKIKNFALKLSYLFLLFKNSTSS